MHQEREELEGEHRSRSHPPHCHTSSCGFSLTSGHHHRCWGHGPGTQQVTFQSPSQAGLQVDSLPLGESWMNKAGAALGRTTGIKWKCWEFSLLLSLKFKDG